MNEEARFDPSAPCIGSDGLEYEDFAARIEGRPLENWRNSHITASRRRGIREETLRIWIEAYDEGGERRTRPFGEASERIVRANFAVDDLGRSLPTFYNGAAEPLQRHPRTAGSAGANGCDAQRAFVAAVEARHDPAAGVREPNVEPSPSAAVRAAY